MDSNKMFKPVNTFDISEVLVNPTTITLEVKLKKIPGWTENNSPGII